MHLCAERRGRMSTRMEHLSGESCAINWVFGLNKFVIVIKEISRRGRLYFHGMKIRHLDEGPSI